jgi:hypothetical protein
MVYLLEDHDTKELPRKMVNSEVEHRISGQPAQSASVYAEIVVEVDANKCKPRVVVPLTYASRLAALHRQGPGALASSTEGPRPCCGTRTRQSWRVERCRLERPWRRVQPEWPPVCNLSC